MPILFNNSIDDSLLSVICQQTQNIANEERNDWIFYVITCYFNPKIANELVNKIREILDDKLKEIHILVDSREFIKQNINENDFKNNIRNIKNLDLLDVSLTPIDYNSKLFHAKSYALINKNVSSGFALITSANFTEAGLKRNIEIGKIFNDIDSLKRFTKIFTSIKNNYSLSVEQKAKQREFQIAVKTLSQGTFYHVWNPSFDLIFRLKLSTQECKRISELSNNEETRTKIEDFVLKQNNTIIRDIINIQSIFDICPRPIPDNFWGRYSIDTLLGRWVPLEISKLIEEEVTEIKKILKPIIKEKGSIKNLRNYTKELDEFVSRKTKEKVVESLGDNSNAVSKWYKQVYNFFFNDNLLDTFICKYEKIEISIDRQEYDLIMSINKRIKDFYSSSDKHTGLGKTFAELKDNDDCLSDYSIKLNKNIEKLKIKARERLEKNRLCELFDVYNGNLNAINSGDKFIAFKKPSNDKTEYERLDGIFISLKKSCKGIYQSELVYKTKNENKNQEILIDKLKVFKRQFDETKGK